jgi:hypothetical protein
MPTALPKFLQKRLANIKWPQLMVINDKHSVDYYLVTDADSLGRACLLVLKYRLDPNYGYITEPGPEKDIYGIVDELTEEAALALPAPYRTQALKTREQNARLRQAWADEVAQHQTAKKVLKEKDGMGAYLILTEREDYEYEGWTLQDVVVP